MDNKRIILIGGAPMTGKSTVAHKVARHFDLPWISTDQMRKIMRKVANRAEHPKLFKLKPEGHSVERLLAEFPVEELLQMQSEEAEAVWAVARAFIKEDWMWTRGFLVEGIHILPHLVARDFGDDARVKAVFLVDDDPSRVRQVVYTRGLSGDAKSYSDKVKEKEVECVARFSRHLMGEIERLRFPWISVTKSDSDLEKVLAAINFR